MERRPRSDIIADVAYAPHAKPASECAQGGAYLHTQLALPEEAVRRTMMSARIGNHLVSPLAAQPYDRGTRVIGQL